MINTGYWLLVAQTGYQKPTHHNYPDSNQGCLRCFLMRYINTNNLPIVIDSAFRNENPCGYKVLD